MSSRICFPFPIRNGSTTTFCPFNPGNTFSTEGNAPKYASAMSVPSGSRNFNCWRNCAGSGAASLPVTPWATTSREASPSNSFCKAAALKPTPPHPAPHTGLKTSSGCCPLPAYSARSNSGNVSVTVTELEQDLPTAGLRHRHAALHEDRVNPDYTIARRQIRRRQAAERRLPDTIA